MKKINLKLCLLLLFTLVSCKTNKVYVDSGNIFVQKNDKQLTYQKENFDFQINKVNTDEIQVYYKYESVADLVGYPLYDDYEGILFLKIDDAQLLPELNIIKLQEKTNGPNVKLLSMKQKGDSISVCYDIELTYTRAAGFGTINVEYQKNDNGYKIVDYQTEINGYFYIAEDGMEIPSLDGDIIYQRDFSLEDFQKLDLFR